MLSVFKRKHAVLHSQRDGNSPFSHLMCIFFGLVFKKKEKKKKEKSQKSAISKNCKLNQIGTQKNRKRIESGEEHIVPALLFRTNIGQ